MKLLNSVAVITGGASGFGKEFVLSLLKQGAKVVIADIDTVVGSKFDSECQEVYGHGKSQFMECDVTNRERLREVFVAAQTQFGGLDIICNNAGIFTADPKLSKKMIDINLTAVVDGTYLGLELMSKKNGGRGGVITNISSAAGLQLMPYAHVYTATKFAVTAFTRTFRRQPEIASEDGVRVNCVCPFFSETDMLRKGKEEMPEHFDALSQFGLADVKDVVTAFNRTLAEDKMHGNCIAVMPGNAIYDVKFPPAQPKSKM